MRKIRIHGMEKEVPAVIVGCMRQAGFTNDPFSPERMNRFIHTALDHGANFFDHADIYGMGRAESVFGRALAMDPSIHREDLIIQSKCGLSRGCFDLSRDYILNAVNGILERLGTEYLDMLLLHRPDALMEPEEVAEAFSRLHGSGKVRHFGVSNFTPGQIALLKRYVDQPLAVDQLELSVVHCGMIASGIEANLTSDGAFDRDGGVLDYCRLNDITIQAWSPMQIGMREGTFLGSGRYPELNRVLEELAEKYAVTPGGIACAWILRHPADMQVVVGTTDETRLVQAIEASKVRLTRPEWYRLYTAGGHFLP